MAKKFDVVAITGKYTNASGEEKSRYMNIGAVIETKNGLSLKLEAVPVGWDGWAGLYEPKDDAQKPQRQQSSQPQRRSAPPADFGDDMPDF